MTVTAATAARPVRQPHGRAKSQRLLVTLFGDYAQHRPPIPSAALVEILEGFGIAPANARAALSRLTQRGMLVRSRAGRRTSYSLTERAGLAAPAAEPVAMAHLLTPLRRCVDLAA